MTRAGELRVLLCRFLPSHALPHLSFLPDACMTCARRMTLAKRSPCHASSHEAEDNDQKIANGLQQLGIYHRRVGTCGKALLGTVLENYSCIL